MLDMNRCNNLCCNDDNRLTIELIHARNELVSRGESADGLDTVLEITGKQGRKPVIKSNKHVKSMHFKNHFHRLPYIWENCVFKNRSNSKLS